MRSLGAKLFLVSYERAWQALDERAFPGIDGTFVHPFDDHNFIAGHGTMALEILEDVAGHGRSHRCNRRRRFDHRRCFWHQSIEAGDQSLGSRTGTAAPAALSFEKGSPQVFEKWKASFVDGAGGQSVFPRMWERMKPVVDGYIVVSLDETRKAMRLMAEKTRVIAEGAGALSLAAALTGKAGKGPIVAVVSGGNIDLEKFSELIAI